MKVTGIELGLIGANFDKDEKGFWVGRILIWGRGNRSLFAIWKSDIGLTIDLFWVRI